jgi:hypothetical protein
VSKEVYHVTWTTYATPKPENQNGEWGEIHQVYTQVQNRGGSIYMPALIASKRDNLQIDRQVILSKNN